MSENRLLFRNIAWNTVGLGLPLLVAVAAFPLLIRGLGTDRFGVLALAWIVVGYFSIFDIGLGRALIKVVAQKRGVGAEEELPGVIYTTLLLMVALGVIGTIVFWQLAPWLVGEVLNIPTDLRLESEQAFKLLAITIPVVVTSSGLSGVLEAHQRFDLVNMIRLPLGMATFLVPLFVLPFSHSLVPITFGLIGVRALACFGFAAMCLTVVRVLRERFEITPIVVPYIIRLGGWMTVSNLVSPLMVYLDRFVIGALLSISSVTFYTTPYEVVTRALLLPRAIMGVLFPEFSFSIDKDPSVTAAMYQRWIKYVFALMFPFTLFVVTFAHDLMNVWLGPEFADKSGLVLQFLAVGVLVNSLAQVSFGLIQGAGRPDITAKIHLFELPFYLVALWWSIRAFGIAGAAFVWMLRVIVDAVLLFAYSGRVLPHRPMVAGKDVAVIGALVPFAVLGGLLPSFSSRLFYFLFVGLIFVPILWKYLLHDDDRFYLSEKLKKIRQGGGA